MFYKKALSSTRLKKIWKIIYWMLNTSQQEWKENLNKPNKHFCTTATQLANAKCQSPRKLRSMVSKLENTHSHSLKIHKISIDETEKKKLKNYAPCLFIRRYNIRMQLINPIASYVATPLTVIRNFIQHEKFPDVENCNDKFNSANSLARTTFKL